MRILSFIILVFLSWISLMPSFGQNADDKRLDSLKQGLVSAKSVENQEKIAEAHINLAKEYIKRYDYPASKGHYESALSFLDSISQSEEWFETRLRIGDLSLMMGDIEQGLSVYHSLKDNPTPATNIKIVYRKIGYAHNMKGTFDQAMEYYEMALTKYHEEKPVDSIGIALIYGDLGILRSRQGNYPKAIENYKKAEFIYQSRDDQQNLLYIYNNISGIYIGQGHYPKALESLQKSLKISQGLGNKQAEAGAISNIGLIYLYDKNYDRALSWFQRALEFNQESGNRTEVARISKNMGTCYENLADTAKALKSYQESLRIRKEIGDQLGIAVSHLAIGNLLLNQGHLQEAEKHIKISRELYEIIGDEKGKSNIYLLSGDLAYYQKNYRESILWCEKGFKIAEALKLGKETSETCYCLSLAYEELGNYKEAHNYQKRFISARDSLNNEENARKLTRLKMQFDFDKEKELIYS